MDLKQGVIMWTGFIKLRIRFSGELLWTGYRIVRLHRKLGVTGIMQSILCNRICRLWYSGSMPCSLVGDFHCFGRNIANHLQEVMASQPRSPQSAHCWQPKISATEYVHWHIVFKTNYITFIVCLHRYIQGKSGPSIFKDTTTNVLISFYSVCHIEAWK
jgi:hypothetical protein